MARARSLTVFVFFALIVERFLGASTSSYGSSMDSTRMKSSDDAKAKEMMTTSKDQSEMSDSDDKNSSDVVDLLAIMNDCNETFRIEMGYIESLNESGSFPDEIDRTPKCYVRCVLEKTRIASQDGQFDPSQAAVVFAGERNGKVISDIQDLATTCAAGRNETCKCERSYRFMKCLMEAEIKDYAEN